MNKQLGISQNIFLKTHQSANNYIRLVVIAIFLVYPILSLPLILSEIYNRKKYAFVLLSIFMGYMAILWAPTGDLYRHNISYLEYKDMPTFELTIMQFDFVLHILSWSFARLGIHFEIIRFLFVTISYLCINYIFFDFVKRHPILERNFLLTYSVLFFSVNFFNITFGLRFGFGCVILTTGYYLIFYKNDKGGWLLSILSIFIHYSLLFIVFTMIVGRLRKSSGKKIAYVGLIFFLIPSTTLLEAIINFLPIGDVPKKILLLYTSGYWSGEFLENRSLLYRIATFLWNVATYYCIYVFYIQKRSSNPTSILPLFLFVWGISSCSVELFSRITNFLVIPLCLWMLTMWGNGYFKIQRIRFLRLLLIIAFISNIYSLRFVIFESKYTKLMYYTSYNILMENYDSNWINKNINPNGSLSKYY